MGRVRRRSFPCHGVKLFWSLALFYKNSRISPYVLPWFLLLCNSPFYYNDRSEKFNSLLKTSGNITVGGRTFPFSSLSIEIFVTVMT